MKRTLSQFVISAAAIVLFGIVPMQAQDVTRGTVPMNFQFGSTVYQAGTYDLRLVSPTAAVFSITSRETGKVQFANATATMEPNEKTQARGPVIILKCTRGNCFVTELWTGARGYSVRHPLIIDEEVASTTHVVALVRAAGR